MSNKPDLAEHKTFFSTLNIIFLGLFSGQIIYFAVALFLIQSGNMQGIEGFETVFMFITLVVVFFSIFASKMIYSKLVNAFDKSKPIEERLNSYRTGNIVKLALIEGANIFTISIMIITADYLYAAFFALLITFFWLNKPGEEKFRMDYAS
jgi:hypothetical protein